MKIADANVLLYAVNESSPEHRIAKDWLDAALGGKDTVGFAWVVLLAFLRIATRAGLFPRPLSPAQALEVIDMWLQSPSAIVVAPTARHPRVLADLIESVGTAGNLVNDAHLAALAVEHRGAVVSFDRDFARFPGVAVVLPS